MTRSSQPPARGSPERLADALLGRIFRGELPAGSRLPAERQLARELGVDRTTLRMALKQLQRMNLLEARHGSGVVVNDYRDHGGLDLLAAVFSLEDFPLEGSFVVEALDFWLEIFSMMAAKAVVRLSLEDLRQLEQLLRHAIAADDAGDFARVLVQLTDQLAILSGSVIFRLLNNSTRSLRERLMRMLPQATDGTAALRQIHRLLRNAALTRPGEETVRRGLLALLVEMTAALRVQLLFGPSAGKPKRGRR